MDAAARARLNRAMTRLADGDRSAFSEVHAGVRPLIARFATRVLADSAEADDVAQRVLLKLFGQASRFDGDVVSWALAITAWECRSARKARARRLQLHGKAPLPELPNDTSVAHEILGELSASDREALLQSEGARSPAARKRKQRALERARTIWRQLYG